MNALGSLARNIDRINTVIGRGTAWLALVMVLVQFAVVVMRYVFGIGSIMLQESVIYLHSMVFMIGAAYTLLQGGHVRVDIFYGSATPKRQALTDAVGALFFLIPVCGLIVFYSWPYVSSSWQVLEGSKETSGIQAVFLLKSMILLFGTLVGLQGVSMLARSVLTLTGASPSDDAEKPADPGA